MASEQSAAGLSSVPKHKNIALGLEDTCLNELHGLRVRLSSRVLGFEVNVNELVIQVTLQKIN